MSIIDDVKELLRDGDVRDGTCDLLLDAIEALSGSSTAIAKIVLSAGRSAFALRDKTVSYTHLTLPTTVLV